LPKRKQDSNVATLFKFGVYLTDKGHLEIQREYLHPNDWLKVVNENFPSYENKELLHKFLTYSQNMMDQVERDLSTYSPIIRPTHHHTKAS
jgi:hypothetical protein